MMESLTNDIYDEALKLINEVFIAAYILLVFVIHFIQIQMFLYHTSCITHLNFQTCLISCFSVLCRKAYIMRNLLF